MDRPTFLQTDSFGCLFCFGAWRFGDGELRRGDAAERMRDGVVRISPLLSRNCWADWCKAVVRFLEVRR